jgi:WD40 repeat protein
MYSLGRAYELYHMSCFSSRVTILASTNHDGKSCLWRLVDWSCTILVPQGIDNAIRSIAFSLDGSILASGSGDGFFRLWKVNDGICIRIRRDRGFIHINAIAFSPDGGTLAIGGVHGAGFLQDMLAGNDRADPSTTIRAIILLQLQKKVLLCCVLLMAVVTRC